MATRKLDKGLLALIFGIAIPLGGAAYIAEQRLEASRAEQVAADARNARIAELDHGLWLHCMDELIGVLGKPFNDAKPMCDARIARLPQPK